jgi:hypothetical protein
MMNKRINIMSNRIFSILLVVLSAMLTSTACKDGGKAAAVTMEELRNTDLSRVIMPDTILIEPDYDSQTEEYVFNEKAFVPRWFEPFGYRGRNFQRFYIHYDSVRFKGNGVYDVYGRTRYRDTIRLFSGIITLDSMRLYQAEHQPSTGEFGSLYGHYQFDEDEFSGGGVLSGKMSVEFAKINGRFYYDAVMLECADGYDNRQYEGVWTSKDLTRMEKCNWGDFRIPDSRGLDIGVGEFSPVDEYSDRGWQVYTYGRSDYDSLRALYQADEQWFTHEEDYLIPYSGRLQRYLKEYGHKDCHPAAKVVLGTIPTTEAEFNTWVLLQGGNLWTTTSQYAHVDSAGIMFAYMRMGQLRFPDGDSDAMWEAFFDDYVELQKEHPAFFEKYRKQLSKEWNQSFDWWKKEMYEE